MALQHTPDRTIIRLTLPDGTYTAFSFGEYLAWRDSLHYPIREKQRSEWIEWFLAEDNEFGRQGAFVSMVAFRNQHPNNPAVREFRRYAIENEIPY